MDDQRKARADAWLDRIGRWAGPGNRKAALACEVVRGIVAVSDPEYAHGVRWAGGDIGARDWLRALELYGSVANGDIRTTRAVWLEAAGKARDNVAVQAALR